MPDAADAFSRFRVILVEPAGAGNVGSVARAMRNLGFSDLALVRPKCDVVGEEARKMALGGIGLIRSAPLLDDLSQALDQCSVTVATTRRLGRGRQTTMLPRDMAAMLAELDPANRIGLVFGREDRGLTNDEVNLCQHVVTIPADPDFESFNLAQAVLVLLWEISSSMRDDVPPKIGQMASHAEVQGMYNDLRDVLDRIGFLAKSNPDRTMSSLSRMIGRMEPTSREVRIVRGTLRDLRWYVRQVAAGKMPPLDGDEED